MKLTALALALVSAAALTATTPARPDRARPPCCATSAAPAPAVAARTVPHAPVEPCSAPLSPVSQAAAEPKEEPLPPAPKSDPMSKHIEAPNLKGVIMEVRPDKTRRVMIATEVCLREGPLEVFLCKKGTKEHEAILRSDVDAQKLHELLLLTGAEAGKPTQFIDAKTETPAYKPATGTKMKVSVHYTKDGKTHTHAAQEWVWDLKKKAPMPHGWVFAGSMIITDPDNGKKFYGANSGDIISISNFPFSMLEIPVEISKDEAQLTYEAKTEKIPAIGSKVWLILEPTPAF
ncbi:Uncharacterized protein OS=Singulisphaera acidiphila (strain ATCC BAA-1392 / DSM 18658 / VKM B-2454 / MOB10) GN=Sinac_5119 PE=4 SV=1 [Gemmataceae bacterium]|nr:Uncharacterized protein OS=Singulisphaera acidiphila (strain ATCC BAA-1392 / DSM 18658 / VKM B-2454 / MOB10) GN=Sinac_5119 PE=4 SV=1 [Gemmataceae bacterium]VTU01346.1 Uncharacterized protein OS=Singulisphaera acidiphila (strain ATCC BAA-1392 / DSM 18658 / VKM B-2454 / MOB10) GN=Sinac_5119 PE=4 SV=1 [Gemmataceae bacterium]